MGTQADPVKLFEVVNPAAIEAAKRKDDRVDSLVRGWEDLEKKIVAAEAEGPRSAWKVELHRQSIEAIKVILKSLA